MDNWNPLLKPTADQIEEYMKSLEIEKEQKDYNPVTKPKHYMLFDEQEIAQRGSYGLGIEVRNVIEKLVERLRNSPLPANVYPLFESDYVQMMQYLMRFMDKGGVEDLKKALWYLDKMIEAY